MRDGFIFYRSFAEAAKTLPDEQRLRLLDAIIDYALDGKEPEPDGVAIGMFYLVRPQIDANNKRYENGKKGGRPKTETKPNENQSKTKTEPKEKDKEKVKDKEKDNVKDKEKEWLEGSMDERYRDNLHLIRASIKDKNEKWRRAHEQS